MKGQAYECTNLRIYEFTNGRMDGSANRRAEEVIVWVVYRALGS